MTLFSVNESARLRPGSLFVQAYAFSFFGIPLLRWFANQRRNAVIEAENNARRDALDRLRLPDPELRAKMQSAAQRAQRRVIRDEARPEISQLASTGLATDNQLALDRSCRKCVPRDGCDRNKGRWLADMQMMPLRGLNLTVCCCRTSSIGRTGTLRSSSNGRSGFKRIPWQRILIGA